MTLRVTLFFTSVKMRYCPAGSSEMACLRGTDEGWVADALGHTYSTLWVTPCIWHHRTAVGSFKGGPAAVLPPEPQFGPHLELHLTVGLLMRADTAGPSAHPPTAMEPLPAKMVTVPPESRRMALFNCVSK